MKTPNISLTTLNGYFVAGAMFFAILVEQKNLPHWLITASYIGAAVCGAARITVGHLQSDAPSTTDTTPKGN